MSEEDWFVYEVVHVSLVLHGAIQRSRASYSAWQNVPEEGESDGGSPREGTRPGTGMVAKSHQTAQPQIATSPPWSPSLRTRHLSLAQRCISNSPVARSYGVA